MRKIHLWTVSTGKVLRAFEGHTDGVRLVGFTADGKTLRSIAADRTIRTWDPATGTQRSSVTMATPSAGSVRAAAVSPDGRHVLAAMGKTTLWVDFATGRVLRKFPASTKTIFTVAFSPDGQTVAWSGADAIVHVWSVKPR